MKGRALSGPIRDISPCDGCAKPERRPGCHDCCPEFLRWKDKITSVRAARREYERRNFKIAKYWEEDKT